MKNLKNLLTTKNLMASYYDNGDHTLEFELDGKTVFLTVRGLGPVDDEYYWDDEENLKKALGEADEEDFEVRYEEI